MKHDDVDTDREIYTDGNDELQESTRSSDIDENELDNGQEVLHSDQMGREKPILTTRVPPPKKLSCADAVITSTSHPNLRNPVVAFPPALLKHRKSAINISHESDIVQALALAKAGGVQNVPQTKAGGDQNVPQHHNPTFELAERFMEATIFIKTPSPIISDEKYSMVQQTWKLAIGAQDCQLALASAPAGAPSVCRLPSGSSLEIDLQTPEAVCVYSVFCSWIGLMMILNLETYIVKTADGFHWSAVGRVSSSNDCLELRVGIMIRDWAANPS